MSYHNTKEMKGQTNDGKQIALNIMCDMIGLPQYWYLLPVS
jgi:hypothetical protein